MLSTTPPQPVKPLPASHFSDNIFISGLDQWKHEDIDLSHLHLREDSPSNMPMANRSIGASWTSAIPNNLDGRGSTGDNATGSQTLSPFTKNPDWWNDRNKVDGLNGGKIKQNFDKLFKNEKIDGSLARKSGKAPVKVGKGNPEGKQVFWQAGLRLDCAGGRTESGGSFVNRSKITESFKKSLPTENSSKTVKKSKEPKVTFLKKLKKPSSVKVKADSTSRQEKRKPLFLDQFSTTTAGRDSVFQSYFANSKRSTTLKDNSWLGRSGLDHSRPNASILESRYPNLQPLFELTQAQGASKLATEKPRLLRARIINRIVNSEKSRGERRSGSRQSASQTHMSYLKANGLISESEAIDFETDRIVDRRMSERLRNVFKKLPKQALQY